MTYLILIFSIHGNGQLVKQLFGRDETACDSRSNHFPRRFEHPTPKNDSGKTKNEISMIHIGGNRPRDKKKKKISDFSPFQNV